MLRRLAIVTTLVINSITYQAAQDLSILLYGNLANVTYRDDSAWAKPRAGGLGGIWSFSNNIGVEGNILYFAPLEGQKIQEGTVEIQKRVFASHMLARFRLRHYIERFFSFDIRDENVYGALGPLFLLPTVDNYEIQGQTKTKRGDTVASLGGGIFVGVGYKANIGTLGVVDIQGGYMLSLSASTNSTWIIKGGIGIRVL